MSAFPSTVDPRLHLFVLLCGAIERQGLTPETLLLALDFRAAEDARRSTMRGAHLATWDIPMHDRTSREQIEDADACSTLVGGALAHLIEHTERSRPAWQTWARESRHLALDWTRRIRGTAEVGPGDPPPKRPRWVRELEQTHGGGPADPHRALRHA